MRKKFAMQKRRDLIRKGAKILHEGFVRQPGWRRKDCGYGVEFEYDGHNCLCGGDDMLEAYKDALWMLQPDSNIFS